MQNEEFKSKKQQRFFYAKANTEKCAEGENWKKMADEFSADTDYSSLDEDLLSELVDKAIKAEEESPADVEKPKRLGKVLSYLKDNPNFISWFIGSDSYLSEQDGTPKVFFHGTNHDFDEFKPSDKNVQIDFPVYYFTENVEYADRYTAKSNAGGNIIPVVINAKKVFNTRNPNHLEIYKQSLRSDGWREDEIETEIDGYFKEGLQHWTSHIALVIAKEQGFDAVLINERVGIDAIVIFDPKNVKSVFDKEFKPSSNKLIGEEKLMEKNEPTNPKLWSRAKAAATRKFDKHSAYKMAWAAKWYKEKGGNWRKKKVNEYVEGMPQGENKVPFVKGAEKVEVKKDATVLGGKNYSQGDINALNITKYESMGLREYIKWYLEEARLRDEIPDYMQDIVRKNNSKGEEYLDMEVPEHTDAIPTVKIAINDSSLRNSIVKELEGGFRNDILHQMAKSELFKNFDRNPKFYNVLCTSLGIPYLKISKNELDKYRLLYLKEFKLLDTKENDIEKPKFGNNKSSILKFIENYNRTFPENSVNLDIEKDKNFLGLRDPIVNYEKNIDSIASGGLYLFITDKPDDKLRIAISKFYDSCQNMYTGSYREKLLANVFDPNSKVAYLIFDVPFRDNMGNQVKYTPVARTMIRYSDGRIMFDRVYSKIYGMEAMMYSLIREKTGLQDQGIDGGDYNYKGIGLPAPYLDRYKIKPMAGSVIDDDEKHAEMRTFASDMGAEIIRVENDTYELSNGEKYEIWKYQSANSYTRQYFRYNWLDYVYGREIDYWNCIDWGAVIFIFDQNATYEDGIVIYGEDEEATIKKYFPEMLGIKNFGDLETALNKAKANINDFFKVEEFIAEYFGSMYEARLSALAVYDGIEHEVENYFIYKHA